MGQIGVCRMKANPRSLIWWPGLDKAIEKVAAQYEPSKVTVAMPKAVAVTFSNFRMAHVH